MEIVNTDKITLHAHVSRALSLWPNVAEHEGLLDIAEDVSGTGGDDEGCYFGKLIGIKNLL